MLKKTKKIFASSKNGCIFASAFQEKTAVDNCLVKSKRTLNYFETRDSVWPGRQRGWRVRAQTSQEGKNRSNSYNEEFDPGSG